MSSPASRLWPWSPPALCRRRIGTAIHGPVALAGPSVWVWLRPGSLISHGGAAALPGQHRVGAQGLPCATPGTGGLRQMCSGTRRCSSGMPRTSQLHACGGCVSIGAALRCNVSRPSTRGVISDRSRLFRAVLPSANPRFALWPLFYTGGSRTSGSVAAIGWRQAVGCGCGFHVGALTRLQFQHCSNFCSMIRP